MVRRQSHDPQSRVFDELAAMVLSILRSPPSRIGFSDDAPAVTSGVVPSLSRRSLPKQISPAGFASLLLVVSLALMICGSVAFFVGFILMPWVLGLVLLFYVAAIVSAISIVGRAILCPATDPPSHKEEISAWKLM